MDLMWLLWGWLIGIPVVSILIARFVLWSDYDSFVDELGSSVCLSIGLGCVWPLDIVALVAVVLTLPRQRLREIYADIPPRPRDLEHMNREELVEKVRYLQKQVDKNVKTEIEQLKKEYAS